jgi:transcriptional regulator with XRE-family HTH domain|nr:MAG TPA: helix-turn-helix XRE-family like protein [Caudoviricetes sp.]
MKEGTLSEFAEIIRSRRKALNLTQKELAEKVGKKRTYIARIEKGETDMQLSSFISISQALGIKLKTEY